MSKLGISILLGTLIALSAASSGFAQTREPDQLRLAITIQSITVYSNATIVEAKYWNTSKIPLMVSRAMEPLWLADLKFLGNRNDKWFVPPSKPHVQFLKPTLRSGIVVDQGKTVGIRLRYDSGETRLLPEGKAASMPAKDKLPQELEVSSSWNGLAFTATSPAASVRIRRIVDGRPHVIWSDKQAPDTLLTDRIDLPEGVR